MSGNAEVDRLNIRDVANVAGVSHMTVSRVINNYPNVRESTRQRVLDVIEELNFRPNGAARALASQRTRRIGLMVDAAADYGPSSTVRAVETAARASGYSVSTISLREGLRSPDEALSHLTDEGVDAICVIAPRSSSVAALRKLVVGVPVLVLKPDSDPHFLTVSVDQQIGTRLALDHLIELGHRDIVHVSGPLDWLDARARERTFYMRAKSWGLRTRPTVVGDWTADFGYDFARSLRNLPDYTAIFAANDEMALGIVHGLIERGIDVPSEMSVVGFDDLPVARHFLPPLTTVRQDFASVGSKAVEVLRAAIEGRELPSETTVATTLVVRESTTAPRVKDGGR
jgi:DNA-binding LacI/PurR family transcriptional regulator